MPAGRPKQAYLCSDCQDTNPDNFYKSRKQQCKKCELEAKQTTYEKQRVNKKIIVREIEGKYSQLIKGLQDEIKTLRLDLAKQCQISEELASRITASKLSPKRVKPASSDNEQKINDLETAVKAVESNINNRLYNYDVLLTKIVNHISPPS
jgi:hypothetical protein